jgi:hypothetical protein
MPADYATPPYGKLNAEPRNLHARIHHRRPFIPRAESAIWNSRL